MGRSSKNHCLTVWLNGMRVGLWSVSPQGGHEFHYVDSWLDTPETRPISLSLPLADAGYVYRGEAVSAFFENLLPDSSEIRQRIKTRFSTASLSAIDLLAEIGRDCVGAVQLLPENQEPSDIGTVQGRSVDDNEIAGILNGITNPGIGNLPAGEEFRISLAGAQEKTALLRYGGHWMVPHGSTPTTHIIKLPLGRIGGLGLDMTNSVENEWLCSRLIAELGVETANCEIANFNEVTALVVERFDRRIEENGGRILRIPQEDFCQVTGTASVSKYESDGGPGIETIMRILLGSEDAVHDRESFFKAQMIFWLLAAPDGHAKNFSVFIRRGGRFKLTPLYDILSVYPVLGHGTRRISPEKLKMAMAFTGQSRHYEWNKIGPRHFRETARRCGFDGVFDKVLDNLLLTVPKALNTVAHQLPAGFPSTIAEPILQGLEKRTKLL